MNATVYTIFREYLEKTSQDRSAAAALTLADVMQEARDAASPSSPPTPAAGQPLTLPEVARHLRVRPNKVLGWVRSGELRAYDVTARQGGRRPKYRVDPDDLAAFTQRRAVASAPPAGRPLGRGHRTLPTSMPSLDRAKIGCAR